MSVSAADVNAHDGVATVTKSTQPFYFSGVARHQSGWPINLTAVGSAAPVGVNQIS